MKHACLSATCLALIAGSALAVPTLFALEPLEGKEQSGLSGMSSDGLVLSGIATRTWIDEFGNPRGEQLACRWTFANGSWTVASLAPMTFSYDISADGGTVVGHNAATQGMVWTTSGNTILSGIPNRSKVVLKSVSGDGSVIVGHCYGTGSNVSARAVRWVNGGAGEELGMLPGQNRSAAEAVSDDGSTITGQSMIGFQWTEADGLESIGELPIGSAATPRATGLAISEDNSTIVGSSHYGAFRWTAETGMVNLGSIDGVPGTFAAPCTAQGVSGDGSIVVGSDGSQAFIWTSETGMLDLNVYLPTVGVNLSGWNLTGASEISADGTVIAGGGTLNGMSRAWIVTGLPPIDTGSSCAADLSGADVGVPDGAVDINDLLFFLAGFEAGSNDVDLDNGTGTGVSDNAVDVNDLLYFLTRFEAGC